ncbi:hypothetical protein L1887_54221 [Cichorium endivia]|nr:hypothetical protein L1887_54221 [Cichorium endivia]
MMVVEEPMLQCPSESAQLGSKPISISITVTRQREKGDVGEEATAQPTKDQHRVSSRAAAARRAAWNSGAPRCCRCAWSKHILAKKPASSTSLPSSLAYSPIDTMSDTPPAAADPTATASDAVDAAEAARLKREARKARILSKGSDRLARITNTGRGEGASAYLNDTTPSLPSTPKPNDATAVAAAAAASVARADDDDPLEVDISTLPRRGGPFGAPFGEDATNPFLMGGSGAGAGEAQNPMEALMAMMQGGPPGAGGPAGAPGQQPDMSGLPPQLAAMMQQFGAAGGGGGPFGGAPGAAMPTAVKTKSLTERLFGVVQATLIVALAVLAAKTSLFDTDHSSVVPDSVTDTFTRDAPAVGVLQRWARLGYQRPSADEWGLNPASTLSSLSMGPLSSLPPLLDLPGSRDRAAGCEDRGGGKKDARATLHARFAHRHAAHTQPAPGHQPGRQVPCAHQCLCQRHRHPRLCVRRNRALVRTSARWCRHARIAIRP